LFYEYFNGDTGAGVGASHQTGWSGIIAFLIQGFTAVQAEKVLEKGMGAVTDASAEVAKETEKTETVEVVAKEVHEQVAEKVAAQVLETVAQHVTEAVQDQGGQAKKIQEKVQEIVMEKVAQAVQKKAEEAQQPNREPRRRRKSFDRIVALAHDDREERRATALDRDRNVWIWQALLRHSICPSARLVMGPKRTQLDCALIPDFDPKRLSTTVQERTLPIRNRFLCASRIERLNFAARCRCPDFPSERLKLGGNRGREFGF
jgi:hypothetical protein